ncbi:unnamed protein product, partial [Adineta steineri]
LSWWFNQLTSTILILVYIIILCYFNWQLIHAVCHSFITVSVINRCLLPFIAAALIHDFDNIGSHTTGFYSWLASYGYVLLRDGPLVLGVLISVIALRYYAIIDDDLSDSTQYDTIDDHFLDFDTQTIIPRQRMRRRTPRKCHCRLVRYVVFGKYHTGRKSSESYYYYVYRPLQ